MQPDALDISSSYIKVPFQQSNSSGKQTQTEFGRADFRMEWGSPAVRVYSGLLFGFGAAVVWDSGRYFAERNGSTTRRNCSTKKGNRNVWKCAREADRRKESGIARRCKETTTSTFRMTKAPALMRGITSASLGGKWRIFTRTFCPPFASPAFP